MATKTKTAKTVKPIPAPKPAKVPAHKRAAKVIPETLVELKERKRKLTIKSKSIGASTNPELAQSIAKELALIEEKIKLTK